MLKSDALGRSLQMAAKHGRLGVQGPLAAGFSPHFPL